MQLSVVDSKECTIPSTVFYLFGANLATDASTQALEAHLFQKEEDGKIGNILFGSRKLLTADKNYTITELELLGIVFACKKFRT